MSWTDLPQSFSPFTSSTSSPGCRFPLRSAAPPFTTRPITTRSPSFRTVAPSGSLCFVMLTSLNRCQLVVRVEEPLELDLVEDVEDLCGLWQVARLESHHALLDKVPGICTESRRGALEALDSLDCVMHGHQQP